MSAAVPVEAPARPRVVIPRERLEFVRDLWLAAEPEHKIVRRTADEYSVTLRTARRYLARVRAAFAKEPSEDVSAIRARADAMLLETYGQARDQRLVVPKKGDGEGAEIVDQPDLKVMAICAWRLAELHGAVAPKQLKHEHHGDGSGKAMVIYVPAEDKPR